MAGFGLNADGGIRNTLDCSKVKQPADKQQPEEGASRAEHGAAPLQPR